jgi:hypothetical protein
MTTRPVQSVRRDAGEALADIAHLRCLPHDDWSAGGAGDDLIARNGIGQ